MTRLQKYLAAALLLGVAFFAFVVVIVRVGIAKPAVKFELAKIPAD